MYTGSIMHMCTCTVNHLLSSACCLAGAHTDQKLVHFNSQSLPPPPSPLSTNFSLRSLPPPPLPRRSAWTTPAWGKSSARRPHAQRQARKVRACAAHPHHQVEVAGVAVAGVYTQQSTTAGGGTESTRAAMREGREWYFHNRSICAAYG